MSHTKGFSIYQALVSARSYSGISVIKLFYPQVLRACRTARNKISRGLFYTALHIFTYHAIDLKEVRVYCVNTKKLC